MAKKSEKNLCDVLGQNAKYVLLHKKDRTLVLDSPSDKLIRDKIKKDWSLAGWVRQQDTETELFDMIRELYSNKFRETA